MTKILDLIAFIILSIFVAFCVIISIKFFTTMLLNFYGVVAFFASIAVFRLLPELLTKVSTKFTERIFKMATWVYELNWFSVAGLLASAVVAIRQAFQLSQADYLVKSLAYDNQVLRTALQLNLDQHKGLLAQAQALKSELAGLQKDLAKLQK